MKKNLMLIGATVVALCLASINAMQTEEIKEPTHTKNGSITNRSDEILNIFLCKSAAGAANVLLANGWTQKSLTLLANTTKVAQTFVQEAAVVNLGIGFLSDFATDVVSSIVAAVSTKAQFLCLTKGAAAEWNTGVLKKKIKNPDLRSVFCLIFATQPDWTTNFKKVMYMGPVDISTNYEYHLGKMVNKDTDEVVSEFTPLEQTKSGVIKKLTEMSAEEIAKDLQKILENRKEREEEQKRRAQKELLKQQEEADAQSRRETLKAESAKLEAEAAALRASAKGGSTSSVSASAVPSEESAQ
jgi:hypothetical protein